MTPQQFSVIGWMTIKILTIVGLALYAVYAGIIVRQEQLMSKVLAESTESVVRLITILHFIAALFLIILALILL